MYMVIGIDAGALCVDDKRLQVGVYQVIYNLLLELSTLDTTNEYRLYSFQPIDRAVLDTFSPSMTNVVLTPAKGWFELRLPLSLLVHPTDLFLGLSQSIPRFAGKSVVLVHDLGFLHHPEAYPQSAPSLKRRTAQAIHRSNRILAVSHATAKDVQSHFHINENRLNIVSPGIHSRFNTHGDVFNAKRPYLLHVGSLKPSKNIPKLIQAFSLFRRMTGLDMDLLLIGGDFWLDKDILPMVTTCGLEERVKLLGHVPDELLPQYYRGASCFVSLSLSEGFCIPIAEAMACGIPVVVSNVGSLPELVAEPSLLSDPHDIETFAHNVEKVLSQGDFRSAVVAKGVGKALSYTWAGFAKGIFDVIQSYEP
jgi:glycosyltransferase involved in cell wall biosynthesis